LSAFDEHSLLLTAKKKSVKNVYWQVLIHYRPEQGIFLQQRPEQGIWAGLWTPPLLELHEKPKEKPQHIHLLTHRRLHLYAKQEDVNFPMQQENEGKWFQSLEHIALPTGIHRLFTVLKIQLERPLHRSDFLSESRQKHS